MLSLKNRQVFETNDDIIKYLKTNNLWFKTEQYLHNYPHCWRTDTPLIYKAVGSWYVKVTEIKEKMVLLNSGKPFTRFDLADDVAIDGTKIKKITKIETARMVAVPFSLEYIDDLASLYSDPEVRKFYYFLDQPIMSQEDSVATVKYWQEYYQQHKLPRLVLLDKKTNEFIGTAGICFYDPRNENFHKGKIELSYQLPVKSWNKGYATEISQALVKYSFENLGVDFVCAATVSDNLISQKLLTKCGFELIESIPQGYPKASRNAKYTCNYYQLSRQNWLKEQDALTKEGINWIPNHLQEGQFGKWLENARDWSITRNRFWGCPVPVWQSTDPRYPRIDVYGSIAELEADFQCQISNLHRPEIDNLIRLNPADPRIDPAHEEHSNCSKMMRVSDVLDCWFESGSMPFAQVHYPFENKQWFEDHFPADFITEYLAQTRGWFYTLMVLSTALFDRAPFKNVICHGTILDENSQKLSKRLRNYADPLDVFATIGSDAMRFYMISQPVMQGQELKIDKEGKAIKETMRIAIKPVINAFNFFCLYANADGIKAERLLDNKNLSNLLDFYILAKLKDAVESIDTNLKNYNTISACESFVKFFEVLNNWYIRRNRERFWREVVKDSNNEEVASSCKQNAYNVLFTCLVVICEAAAPLLPFTTEHIWQGLVGKK